MSYFLKLFFCTKMLYFISYENLLIQQFFDYNWKIVINNRKYCWKNVNIRYINSRKNVRISLKIV